MLRILNCLLLTSLMACHSNNNTEETTKDNTIPTPVQIGYTVLKTYPHDTSSYTQGLLLFNNDMYEGTGRYGFSKIAKVNIETGKAIQQQSIPASEFGEGITIFNNKIYQLTWQEHVVHVYDAKTFKKIKDFNWPLEGWGLTHDSTNLIISTGSNTLYWVNPETFEVVKSINVVSASGLEDNLNELEYVNGLIYANKYLTNNILKINPHSGRVEGILNLKDIFQISGKAADAATPEPQEDVLNGIAYNPKTNTFFVTGKQWNTMFEIKLN